jgi:Protein of unknown function (DUF2630)
MEDQDILSQINALADEEHRLFLRAGTDEPLSDDEHRRMKEIEVRLDQCWDLLHQRRARRNAGLNPDEAEVRDPEIVENYVE